MSLFFYHVTCRFRQKRLLSLPHDESADRSPTNEGAIPDGTTVAVVTVTYDAESISSDNPPGTSSRFTPGMRLSRTAIDLASMAEEPVGFDFSI